MGGRGLDAPWSDDFHHALHVAPHRRARRLLRRLRRLWPTSPRPARTARLRRPLLAHSAAAATARPPAVPAERFVVCAQNHDQVGNRRGGERLEPTGPLRGAQARRRAVLLSPFVPLLFMGEEYGAASPFPYFTRHADPDLGTAVREGRRREFAAFGWDPRLPDPQADRHLRRGPPRPLRAPGGGRRRRARTRDAALLPRLMELRRALPGLRPPATASSSCRPTRRRRCCSCGPPGKPPRRAHDERRGPASDPPAGHRSVSDAGPRLRRRGVVRTRRHHAGKAGAGDVLQPTPRSSPCSPRSPQPGNDR